MQIGKMTIPANKVKQVVSTVTEFVKTAEAVLGAKSGPAKRKLVINAVREAIPALNENRVPDWLEDAAIGTLVDLIVSLIDTGHLTKG